MKPLDSILSYIKEFKGIVKMNLLSNIIVKYNNIIWLIIALIKILLN